MSSTLTTSSLEERVATLESEVTNLKLTARLSRLPRKKWWRDLLGKYKDNPDFEEAMRLGREYRESQTESD